MTQAGSTGMISAHDMRAPRQCRTFADVGAGVNPLASSLALGAAVWNLNLDIEFIHLAASQNVRADRSIQHRQ